MSNGYTGETREIFFLRHANTTNNTLKEWQTFLKSNPTLNRSDIKTVEKFVRLKHKRWLPLLFPTRDYAKHDIKVKEEEEEEEEAEEEGRQKTTTKSSYKHKSQTAESDQEDLLDLASMSSSSEDLEDDGDDVEGSQKRQQILLQHLINEVKFIIEKGAASDPTLTFKGLLEADNLMKHTYLETPEIKKLLEKAIRNKKCLMFVSPTLRTLQTAKPWVSTLGLTLKPLIVPVICERGITIPKNQAPNWISTLTWDRIQSEYGTSYNFNFCESSSTTPPPPASSEMFSWWPKRYLVPEIYINTKTATDHQKEEGKLHYSKRVVATKAWLESLITDTSHPYRLFVLVSHGTFLSDLAKEFSGSKNDYPLQNTAILHYRAHLLSRKKIATDSRSSGSSSSSSTSIRKSIPQPPSPEDIARLSKEELLEKYPENPALTFRLALVGGPSKNNKI